MDVESATGRAGARSCPCVRSGSAIRGKTKASVQPNLSSSAAAPLLARASSWGGKCPGGGTEPDLLRTGQRPSLDAGTLGTRLFLALSLLSKLGSPLRRAALWGEIAVCLIKDGSCSALWQVGDYKPPARNFKGMRFSQLGFLRFLPRVQLADQIQLRRSRVPSCLREVELGWHVGRSRGCGRPSSC